MSLGPAGSGAAQLFVLGGLRLRTESREITAADLSANSTRLLELLALNAGHRLHREQVVDVLWPDAAPRRAFNNLYKTVHQLRSAIGTEDRDLVELRRCTIGLRREVTVDLDEFERAAQHAYAVATPDAYEEAISRYGGELLPDEDDEWISARRLRARDLIDELHASYAEAVLGRHDQPPTTDTGIDVLVDNVPTMRTRRRLALVEASSSAAHERAPVVAPPLHVGFTSASDGTRLAYAETGKGSTLICLPRQPFSHVLLEWELPASRHWYEAISPSRRLIRFDGRGQGLSQRANAPWTPDAALQDLEAIVESTGTEEFDLFAELHSCATAVRYAASHPRRVRHLVLWQPYVNGSWITDDAALRFHRRFAPAWEWYCHFAAYALSGSSIAESSGVLADVLIASSSAEHAERVYQASGATDISSLVREVDTPALVLHRPAVSWPPPTSVEDIAALLRNGRLIRVPGSHALPFDRQAAEAAVVLRTFLEDAVGEEVSVADRTVR